MKIKSILGFVMALALVTSVSMLVGCAKPAAEKVAPAPAAQTPAASTGAFQVGQAVAAKWTDGNLWLAKVTAVNGDQIGVQFSDDNSKLTVTAADVYPIEETTWAVGSDVLAVWTSGRFYPGQITEANGNTYTVKWEDGSEPSQVTGDKIISVP